MGKVLKFGRNNKNYKLPVGKTKAISGQAVARKILREVFDATDVSKIEKELHEEVREEIDNVAADAALLAELQAEAEQNEG